MIKHLTHQAEGKTLAFKRDLSSPQPILKTLLAFANTAGGRLLIGISRSHAPAWECRRGVEGGGTGCGLVWVPTQERGNQMVFHSRLQKYRRVTL